MRKVWNAVRGLYNRALFALSREVYYCQAPSWMASVLMYHAAKPRLVDVNRRCGMRFFDWNWWTSLKPNDKFACYWYCSQKEPSWAYSLIRLSLGLQRRFGSRYKNWMAYQMYYE